MAVQSLKRAIPADNSAVSGYRCGQGGRAGKAGLGIGAGHGRIGRKGVMAERSRAERRRICPDRAPAQTRPGQFFRVWAKIGYNPGYKTCPDPAARQTHNRKK